MKPEFIDNLDGNTMLKAIREHLKWLRETRKEPVEVWIATGYFNPAGFGMIAEELAQTAGVKLLLGAEPFTPPRLPKRKPGDKRGEAYEREMVDKALQANELGLLEDRDILGFSPEVDSTIVGLLDFLESGNIEVRRYTKKFLHGKAFIFATDSQGVVAGSSNFTAAGFTANLELNLGHYQPNVVESVKDWFVRLWDEADPYDLAAIYEARYQPYDPYLIYLRVLYELYGDELQEEQQETGITLTSFQNDGVFRAKRILEGYNGVIIADGVGLGKSYIGGELIREAVQDRRQRALLVSPAVLRDGSWERFQHTQQIYFEKVSYEELAMDRQLGGEYDVLKSKIEDYALIVIDEAHAFRNPDTQRARSLRRLVRGTPPKKLVLLTATPVNNTLWDLYNLLRYFVGHDAVFADKGIRSLKERFSAAVDEDPFELRPDVLFDILDATTVRRTRSFVKKYYPSDKIMGPEGEMVTITFPTSHVRKVEYDLDQVLPNFFEDFADALAPEEGEPALTLARYWPSQYKIERDPEHEGREVALVGLLRSGMLKRFESSAYAFAETVTRMADTHDAFLAALDEGYIASPDAIVEWGASDTDDNTFEYMLIKTESKPATGYDIKRLRAAVEHDRNLLRDFAATARQITQANDPKLEALADALASIAEDARLEGLDEIDEANKRKVVIFSYFADTVQWIEEYLLRAVETDPRLAAYRGRIASVSSAESELRVSREDAVFGFAPDSTFAPAGKDENKFDILITTDVLAEGENLQQARHIINYDLPWNPMRLVQRNGRIDRIGSLHPNIYIRCFFPDMRLDNLLTLEQRIRVKLAQAAASIGVEGEVIPEGATSDVVFTETVEQIRQLQHEEAQIFETAGEDVDAYSGEEYRQELRKGLEVRRREILSLPWAAGSGFKAYGKRSGFFFCAQIGDEIYLRFVPDEGSIIDDKLTCLSTITCFSHTERHFPDELYEHVYDAWDRARTDIYRQWQLATDPANLQPKVRPMFIRVADHLRQYPPSTVTSNELTRVLEAIEAPWAIRIERKFRDIYQKEELGPQQKSQRFVELVNELGLEPFVPPEPLPIIDEEEVRLIVWMAVSAFK